MEQLHAEGETIGQRYRIDGILGEGGSGTTYRSQDLQTGQAVALKALSLRHLSDWKMIELFEREAAVLAQLDHTAIPRYLEYFHVDTPSDRCFYIAQELADGESLAALVEKGWHATETEVRSIAIKLLEILVYLHQLKPPVIHRDIKPQNIIRRDDGLAYLVDFGAVQQTYHSTLARGSTVVGTFGYMAPEQFTGKAVLATDLYGLGATLLFLLTHRSPAELPTDRLKIDFRSHVQISEEFAGWLSKMLEPDVGERFHNASEALAVLQGKRKLKVKARSAKQWKRFVQLGIAAVVAVGVVHYRYPIIYFLGIIPYAFFEAASQGDVETVRYYLETGINVNVTRGRQGRRIAEVALHLAGNAAVAELLIAKGADVNAKDEYGHTPLGYAASNGKLEIVKLLLAKGADVNAKNRYADTPLHGAARGKLEGVKFPLEPWYYGVRVGQETVELLLAKGADVNAKNRHADTPLHYAATGGNLEIVKLLLDRGADVNARSNWGQRWRPSGQTPLHYAASAGQLETVELLLAKGADVNAKDKDGNTPLHYAAEQGKLEIVKLLLTKDADVNAKSKLHEAAMRSNWEVVELLLAKGADVNAKDEYGNTILLYAGTLEKVEWLLAKGADVNAKNRRGKTLLHYAAGAGPLETVKLLLDLGADVNAKTNSGHGWGETPLHNAAGAGKLEIVKLLLAKGADVNAKDDYGHTPLHYAAGKEGKLEVVKLLLAKGADVNAKDDYGHTPLHYAAAKEGKLEVVKLLLDLGADVNAKNDYGKIPLQLANNSKIVTLLKSHGVRH